MSKSTRGKGAEAGHGNSDADKKQKDFEPTGYELMEQSKQIVAL